MRIVCDNCGAKYSIADEKVAGKVLRIRCKACSNVINVDGRHVTKEDDAATAFGQTVGDIEWHVVIDGDQQGPFSEGQVAQMLSSGALDLESYVWRDGFDGWKTIADVPELQGAATPADDDGGSLPNQGDSLPIGGAATGLGSASAGASGGVAGSASGHADRPNASLGAAMSGASAASASLGAGAPQPLTGKRNENSVLFSLANLQALSAKPGGPASAPASTPPRAGGATTEGSGLIDIRALASTSGGGSSVPVTDRGAAVDQLMSIGTGTPLASPLSPVIAAGHDDDDEDKGGKSKQLMVAIIIAGALVFVGMAALAAVIILKPDGGANAAIEPLLPDGSPTAADPATPNAAAEPPTKPADPEVAKATDEPVDENPSPPPSEREAKPAPTGSARKSTRTSSAAKGRSDNATPTASATSKKPSGGSDIDSLLAQAAGGGAAKPKPSTSSADDNLPETPTADSVLKALKAVQGDVRACGNGQHGIAKTAVAVNGSTGRVTSAKVVSGPFVGTPVAGCVERAVRKASFPRFKRTSFSLDFPFTI